MDRLLKYVELAFKQESQPFEPSDWQKVHGDCPSQDDSNSCGPRMLAGILLLSVPGELGKHSFSAEQIKNFRRRLVLQIIRRRSSSAPYDKAAQTTLGVEEGAHSDTSSVAIVELGSSDFISDSSASDSSDSSDFEFHFSPMAVGAADDIPTIVPLCVPSILGICSRGDSKSETIPSTCGSINVNGGGSSGSGSDNASALAATAAPFVAAAVGSVKGEGATTLTTTG